MRPQKDLSPHLYSCLGSPSHAWAQQSSDQAAQSCHLVAAPTNDMAVLTAGGHQPAPPLSLSKTDLQGAGATKLDPPGYSGSGEDEAHRRTHIPLTGNERCRDGPGSATIPGRQMRERQQRCWGCERGEVKVPGWT